MNILSVDTATSGMSVSLFKNDLGVSTKSYDNMRGQAGMLLPLILELLDEAEIDFFSLDALVVAIGPGSFTGIRVGLSAMQGIALAADKPLVGFNSFEIYASNYGCTNNEDGMLVVLESHRKEAFCQLYDLSGNIYGEPFQTDIDNINVFLPNWDKILVVGNANDMLLELGKSERYRVNDNDKSFGSENLGEILLKMVDNITLEIITKKYLATPFYIRPPDITISKKI